jgi:hypothetical protein
MLISDGMSEIRGLNVHGSAFLLSKRSSYKVEARKDLHEQSEKQVQSASIHLNLWLVREKRISVGRDSKNIQDEL